MDYWATINLLTVLTLLSTVMTVVVNASIGGISGMIAANAEVIHSLINGIHFNQI